MAFTNSPNVDTYSTHDFPLVRQVDYRDNSLSKDVDYQNFIFETNFDKLTNQQEIILRKREGSTQFIANRTGGDIRGMYFWHTYSRTFTCIGNSVYWFDGSGTLINSTVAFTTSSGPVGFTEFLYDTGNTALIASDGTRLCIITPAGAVTVVTTVPNPHDPNIVYIDGYCIVLTTDGRAINCNVNDPTSWSAGANYIVGEIQPDLTTRIGKLNNYLLLLGNESIEFCYDAANPTGTPFQRSNTYVKYVGYAGGYAAVANRVYFIGNNADSQLDVFMLEDSNISPIGNPAIRKFLNTITNVAVGGYIISLSGSDYYVIQNSTSVTWAYHIQSGLWTRLAWQGNTHMKLTGATNAPADGSFKSLFSVTGTNAIYKFDPTLYQDNGTNFTAQVITNNEDFGTYNRKTMSRLAIVGDKPTSSNSVSVSWSDDDYQNFSTPVSVDLYQEYPSTRRLGIFRRRAFKVSHTANAPLRLARMEVTINKGYA
jgi:hypothetical protein